MGLLGKLFGGKPKEKPVSITSQDAFERLVLKSDIPVVLDVWGPQCPPCKMLEPVITKLAGRYAGQVLFAEMSTQAEAPLLGKLRISATPTIIVFHKGKEMGREMGFKPQSWFDEMIQAEFLSGDNKKN